MPAKNRYPATRKNRMFDSLGQSPDNRKGTKKNKIEKSVTKKKSSAKKSRNAQKSSYKIK